jgi:hypothetical protein
LNRMAVLVSILASPKSCTSPNDCACSPLPQSQVHRTPSTCSSSILHCLACKMAKLKPNIVFSLPHEPKWTLKTKAPDCLNQIVCIIHGWGKNWTVCVIRGWDKNQTVCAICGRTCLLYNNYTMYNCF